MNNFSIKRAELYATKGNISNSLVSDHELSKEVKYKLDHTLIEIIKNNKSNLNKEVAFSKEKKENDRREN